MLSEAEFAALIEELRRGADEEEGQETEREKLDNKGLQLLQEEKVEEFNKLRSEHPEWIPNFAGERFEAKKLQNVNLSGAILSHCEFKGCNLSYGKFDHADLQHTTFDKVDAFHGDFRGADLSFCKIEISHFSYSDFSEAVLDNLSTDGVEFNGVDFSGARFCDADIQSTSFHGAKFLGVYFLCTIFCDVSFLGADFEGADFDYVDFTGCNLTGVLNLDAKHLIGSNISGITVGEKDIPHVREALNAIRSDIKVSRVSAEGISDGSPDDE